MPNSLTEKISMVYVTTKDVAQAETIASVLLDERLAVCANIIPGIISFFRWEGRIDRSNEAIMILKIRSGLFPAVEERIRKLHSYDIPCIISFESDAVSAPFKGWVMSESLPK